MDEIKGVARVKFLPGKLDEWKRLTEQAMEIVRTRDPGTLQYEVFFNDNESEAIVFERYRDADAALQHFANIGHLMEPLMATATVTGEILGTPNDTMRAQLGGDEPKLFTPWMTADVQTASLIGPEAQRPNPALEPLTPLVGQWHTTGTHPLVPGRMFHGRTSFEWHEHGAFVLMRSEIDEPEIPSAVAFIGSDDAAGTFTMIYFDERDISRQYTVEVSDGEVRWHRDEAGFAQRMVLTVAADGSRLDARGTMSRDGGPWEDDLQLVYERIN